MLGFWLKIKENFREKFYDDVEIGGSFTFYEEDGRVGDIYHIVGMENNSITYQKTWYGYKMDKERTLSFSEFKGLVSGGDYHDSDYLYKLR